MPANMREESQRNRQRHASAALTNFTSPSDPADASASGARSGADPLAHHRRLSLAPMMDVTDRHFRYFIRTYSPNALLYSEMITTKAIIHGQRDKLLGFHPAEKPLALQLGGNDPQELAMCAKIAQDYGYDEVNLNVGCPSDRVQSGKFGACLIAHPQCVSDCLSAMQAAVSIPVTIKTRIGIDHTDSYDHFAYFIESIAKSSVKTYIIHARKAWLSGVSAKKNRQIPPLRYDYVYRIAREHPDKSFIVNGGITTLESVQMHFTEAVQGVMIGREAQRNPNFFAQLENELFHHSKQLPTPLRVLDHYTPYLLEQFVAGARLRELIRPLYGLFLGLPRATFFRGILNEMATQKSNSYANLQEQLATLRNNLLIL